MNKRNLHYVKKLNPKKQIRLVDNKNKTKNFLSNRGIPVGETFALIKDRKQLFEFDFGKISEDFVVKPNGGSMGNGIFVVKRLSESVDSDSNKLLTILDKKFSYWLLNRKFFPYQYKVSGKIISDLDLKKKLLKIVEGNYSSGSRSTHILVEEKLVPGSGFEKFCEFGLADIRVICCNLVPVAAMVRVPTEKSDGKANLAQGGIGLGIDIATGRVKSLAVAVKSLRPKYYEKDFPEEYKEFYQAKIPFWSDILSYSASVQYFVNMGFVGIDWVITESGPKLLEVNGKAGLAIQNISMVPLEKVLSKISDLKITTPQKGVEIAKSLFSTQKQSIAASGKVVYLSQKGSLSWNSEEGKGEQDVIVEVSYKNKRSYVSQKLFAKIKDSEKNLLRLSGSDTKFSNLNLYESEKLKGYRVQLGIGDLEKYYIKPIHKMHPSVKFLDKNRILEDELDSLQILDQKIYEISKSINMPKYLNPVNYLDEFDKFVSKGGKYNPVFSYDFPSNEEFVNWETKLKRLVDEHQGGKLLHSDFAKLFYQKMDELELRLKLLKAYKKQDFGKILEYNQAYYGDLDKEILELSKQKVDGFRAYPDEYLGKKLGRQQILKHIDLVLKKYKFKQVKVDLNPQMLSRISVKIGNQCAINLSPNALFGENELISKLEHEIGVHVRRFLAGKKSGWFLLSRGTAFYQTDEEGLAVYVAEQKYKEKFHDYENQAIYQNYRLASQAQSHNFQQLAGIILQGGFLRTRTSGYATAFNKVLKQKRGIKNTKIIDSGAVYFRGKAYLEGYLKVKKWVEEGGDIEKLMVGKIKIDDLKYILAEE